MGRFCLLYDKKKAVILIYEEKCLEISRARRNFVVRTIIKSTLQIRITRRGIRQATW